MTSNQSAQTVTTNGCLLLPGLDGSNPLAFLAALGTLRMLNLLRARGAVRMSWSPYGGRWVPSISADATLDEGVVLDDLQRGLVKDISEHPLRLLEDLNVDDVNARRSFFHEQCDGAAWSVRDRADWLAALASDITPADVNNQLQTTRRDYHYGNLTSIIQRTSVQHLRRSIFQAWDYADALDNQSLHLDPSEDRRHAYQWNKPAGDPDRKTSGGMLGANRLAIEAIPLFTSFPEGGMLRTVGFTGNRSTDTRWTWPIWRVSLDLGSVVSLLSMVDIQSDNISPKNRRELHQRGIAAVFRCDRILVQKTPNFTPARRIA